MASRGTWWSRFPHPSCTRRVLYPHPLLNLTPGEGLCSVEGGLLCLLGTGDGHFLKAVVPAEHHCPQLAGKKMGVSEIPSHSCSVLSPFLLQPVFGVLDCEGFCPLRCQLWLSSSPGLYGDPAGGSTAEQGSGWPKPRDAAKDAKQGLGRVPKGTEVHGALEDNPPEELPWWG